MKINVSFQNFKKNHIKKKSQVVYVEKRCLDYAKIENNSYATMQKSYDGDYTRDDDGDIVYTLEGYEEDEDA